MEECGLASPQGTLKLAVTTVAFLGSLPSAPRGFHFLAGPDVNISRASVNAWTFRIFILLVLCLASRTVTFHAQDFTLAAGSGDRLCMFLEHTSHLTGLCRTPLPSGVCGFSFSHSSLLTTPLVFPSLLGRLDTASGRTPEQQSCPLRPTSHPFHAVHLLSRYLQ